MKNSSKYVKQLFLKLFSEKNSWNRVISFTNKLVSRKNLSKYGKKFFWSWFHVKFVKIKKFLSFLCSNFREITNLNHVFMTFLVWASDLSLSLLLTPPDAESFKWYTKEILIFLYLKNKIRKGIRKNEFVFFFFLKSLQLSTYLATLH